MAKAKVNRSVPKNYPRIDDESSKYDGYLDDGKLQEHIIKIDESDFKQIILDAVRIANEKSSRRLLEIPEDASDEDIQRIYKKQGKVLFDYFRESFADPASSAHQCLSRHYSDVAREQWRSRTIQKERMNSGWRYQYIAKDAAIKSGRFLSVSDIGSQESDFNAIIKLRGSTSKLSIYVSVKNRSDTVGGQDYPKLIQAMENIAKLDKNRDGAYICVVGIAMEKGLRIIRRKRQTGEPYSMNAEMWKSDYFWPFFSNYSYDEVVKLVLDVLIATQKPDDLDVEVPSEVILRFGDICEEWGLTDGDGKFNDAYALVKFFCGVS